ncbi:hypothetical protein ACOKM3_14140 [Streptomyces sp. BH106]|uniref:hypothetical protein n=1 Tax=Streptomyces sp. BH106 TaxID=3410409 RepID=UPI003CFB2253
MLALRLDADDLDHVLTLALEAAEWAIEQDVADDVRAARRLLETVHEQTAHTTIWQHSDAPAVLDALRARSDAPTAA